MELRDNNPFSLGLLTFFSDGSMALLSKKPKFIKSPNDRTYTTSVNDNFSNISYQAYGDSKYWWVIWFANNTDFPFELEVLPGTVLNIPDITNLPTLN